MSFRLSEDRFNPLVKTSRHGFLYNTRRTFSCCVASHNMVPLKVVLEPIKFTKTEDFDQCPYLSRKRIAIIFFENKMRNFVDFMERGSSVTANPYFKLLTRLRRAIQNRRTMNCHFCFCIWNVSLTENGGKTSRNSGPPLSNGSFSRRRTSMQKAQRNWCSLLRSGWQSFGKVKYIYSKQKL